MAAYNCRWFKSSAGTLPVNQKGVESFCQVFQGVQMLWESELGEAWMIFVAKNGRRIAEPSCPSEANFVKFLGVDVSL